MRRSIRIMLLLALAGYVASLFLPAFNCRRPGGHTGYEILQTGWMGLLVLDPRWLANLTAFWLASATFAERPAKHIPLIAGMTLVLALTNLLIPALSCDGSGGSAEWTLGLGAGGYLWVASVSLVAVTGLVGMRQRAVRGGAPAHRADAVPPVGLVRPARQARGGSTSRTLVIVGLVIGGLCPLTTALLIGVSLLMPGCSLGGSGGPAYGCHVGSFSLDWLIGLVTPAFVLSFFTAPAGLLFCLVGAIWPRKKTVSAPAQASGVEAAVHEAPEDSRAGRMVRTHCPRCHSFVSVIPDEAQYSSGSTSVRVICACGACDGAFELIKNAPAGS